MIAVRKIANFMDLIEPVKMGSFSGTTGWFRPQNDDLSVSDKGNQRE